MSELKYAFVPYPVELSILERQHALPATHLRILALRRFADAVTGEFHSTTRELARLTWSGRSTVQRVLRRLERAGFLHLDYERERQQGMLVVTFGGFPAPRYLQAGKRELRWDGNKADVRHAVARKSLRRHATERMVRRVHFLRRGDLVPGIQTTRVIPHSEQQFRALLGVCSADARWSRQHERERRRPPPRRSALSRLSQ